MRCRAERLSPVRAGGAVVAAPHGLSFAGGYHRRPRHERPPAGWPEVFDLVLLRQHLGPQHRAAGEGRGVVGGVADHTAVDEPVLLQKLLPHRHLEYCLTVHKSCRPRPHQRAERLGLRCTLAYPRKFVLRPSSPSHARSSGHLSGSASGPTRPFGPSASRRVRYPIPSPRPAGALPGGNNAATSAPARRPHPRRLPSRGL